MLLNLAAVWVDEPDSCVAECTRLYTDGRGLQTLPVDRPSRAGEVGSLDYFGRNSIASAILSIDFVASARYVK